MNRTSRTVGLIVLLAAGPRYILPQSPTAGAGVLPTASWHVVNDKIITVNEGGRTIVRFEERPGGGMAWNPALDLADGDIEFDVKGRDVLQKSFVGVAFHITSDTTFDLVYLRPFNFRAADSTRHAHAVQYVTVPEHPWEQLRTEHPGV
jgi:hypothetical protein